MPVPEESESLQGSRAIRPSEYDGRAAGARRRAHVESRPRGLTEQVFGLPRPHGSQGWRCNLLED